MFLNDKASLSLLTLTPADGVTHIYIVSAAASVISQTDGRTDTHAGGRAVSPRFSALFTHLIQIAFLIRQVRVTMQPQVVAFFFLRRAGFERKHP